VDEAEEAFVVSQGPGRKTVTVPYDEFRGGPVLMRNFLMRAYTDRVRDMRDLIGIHADRLAGRDRRIFYAALFLSVLMISIPLTFAFNDAGWVFRASRALSSSSPRSPTCTGGVHARLANPPPVVHGGGFRVPVPVPPHLLPGGAHRPVDQDEGHAMKTVTNGVLGSLSPVSSSYSS